MADALMLLPEPLLDTAGVAVALVDEPLLLEPLLEAAGVPVALVDEPLLEEPLLEAGGVMVMVGAVPLLELPLLELLLPEVEAGVLTTTPLTVPTCFPF